MKNTLIILFLLLSGWMFSQTASLNGKVMDAATGETLTGASVTVKGVGTFSTNFDGYFDLSSLKPGVYSIVCEYLSYAGKTIENVEVKAGESTFVYISLEDPTVSITEGTAPANAAPAATSSIK